MAGKPFALRIIGANGYYSLWALMPTSMLMGSLPSEQQSNSSVSYYLVSFKKTTQEFSSSFPDLADGIMAFWFFGTVLFLCRLLFAHRQHRDSLHLGAIDKRNNSFTDVFAQLKYHKNLSLKVSANNSGPFIGGLLKPYIVLPTCFTKRFNPEQQKLVIKHELTHLRRGDLLWNLLAQIVVALFWFNPLSFVAYKQFRQCQELACDQSVLENCEKSTRISYGTAMLLCTEQNMEMSLNHLNYGSKNTMQERIEQLKQHKPQPLWRGLTAAGLMLTIVMSVNLVSAKGTDKAKLEPESPIIRIEPIYPIEAAENGIEGSVILSFDIQKNGKVSHVNIVSAEPKGIFERAAKDAVQQWKYKALEVQLSGLLVQLDFALNEDSATNKITKNEAAHEKIAVIRE
jgi:TonB family protein